MNNLSKQINVVLSAGAAVAMILMMLHTVAHSIARYAFQSPFYGTNELVAYWYLPIIALLGFATAQYRKQHISVDIIYDNLRRRNKGEYTVFSAAVGFFVSVGFAWFGLDKAISNMQTGTTAGVTSVAVWPITFLVPVAFGLLASVFILDIVRAIRAEDDGGYPNE